MRTLLIALLSLTSTIILAQQTVVWTGGTPGRETNWNEAKNWSTNSIPDEFSDVLIRDVSTSTFASPVIKEGRIELNSITIESNAQLTIESSAIMVIHFETEGVIKESLNLKGTIIVLGEDATSDLEDIAELDNK